ncbi:pentatricopeptide repeat-containing protein [Citrus sinensis]|nr:pentatricopeptide repeat-containing protein [Citrus sinensis]
MKATNSPTKKKRKKKKEVFPSVWFLASAFLLVWFLGNAFCFCLISVLSDPPSRSCLCSLFIAAALICSNQQCRLPGTEALPEGIVSKTSNLEMRPLWSSPSKLNNQRPPMNLLAIAAGIKQKKIVDQIVRKFPSKDFVVMLFHYDGVVDEWKDLVWADRAIHVSAANQTKWWFAKRFLHPDIVAEYNYIFLWDEDIGVENFNPRRYLSIVKDEGLEISQPALDPVKSEVHHPITARRRNSKAHRRMYKYKGSGRCDDYSTAPPCIGWVEMMAPVFSRAAWRCAWYMIQNDLIHAWGLDIQLGYCAQGDRTKNVGVVDSEYIVHLGLPTLGNNKNALTHAPSQSRRYDNRPEVRRQSYIEMQIFRNRWKHAVEDDKCWVDPYGQSTNQTSH